MSGSVSSQYQYVDIFEGLELTDPYGAQLQVDPLTLEAKSTTSITEVHPLTQALRNRYKDEKYGARLKRLLYEDTHPIADSFINLVLVDEEEQKEKEKAISDKEKKRQDERLLSFSFRDESLESFESIHTPKKVIELCELFKPGEGEAKEAPKRLLIEGRAGIGKTILCQYMAYHWAIGEEQSSNPLKSWSQNFAAVIWLPLREINEYQKSTDILASIIQRECLLKKDRAYWSVEKIKFQIEQWEKEGRVLYLLDGYDELTFKKSKDSKELEDSKEGSSLKKEEEEWEILTVLWRKEWCILTTRPYHVANNTVWPQKTYRRLENIGFTNEDIQKYVPRFFKDFGIKEKTTSVLQSFERHPSIKSAAHIPIVLELICSAWVEDSFENMVDTLTGLYEGITRRLKKRYQQRHGAKASLDNALLPFLEALAWTGIRQRRLILKPEDFIPLLEGYCFSTDIEQHETFLKDVVNIGFVKGTGHFKTSRLDQSYYFIHLTFQEFFAARYLVTSLKQPTSSQRYQEAIKFVKEHKYNSRYLWVISFAAGLLSLKKAKESEVYIHRFWEILLSEPYDLTGAGHLRLTMACLEEARCDKRIKQYLQLLEEIRNYLRRIIETHSDFIGNLLLSYRTQVGVIGHSVVTEMIVETSKVKNKRGVFYLLNHIESFFTASEVLECLQECLRDKDWHIKSSGIEDQANTVREQGALKDVISLLGSSEAYCALGVDKANQCNWTLPTLVELGDHVMLFAKDKRIALFSTSLSVLMEIYERTERVEWTPIIVRNAIAKDITLTYSQGDLFVYDGERVKLFSFGGEKRKLLFSLVQAFNEHAKEVGLPIRFSGHDSLSSVSLLGGFMSGSDSSSSSSEVKAGSSSVQAEDRLRIDFAALQKTAGRIDSEGVRKLVEETLSYLQGRAKKFNDDKDEDVGELSYFIDSLDRLISYITSRQEVISKKIKGDDHSKKLALAILEKVIKEARRVHSLIPSPSAKPQPTYWQENRLRLEQQLLLGESKAANAFRGALAKIETKGPRDYTSPNRVFICYAWPDEKDSREDHLKWVQPFLVELRGHLRAAGIMAKLDIKDGAPGGDIYEYMREAETSDYVLLMGTETLVKKHKAAVPAVCTELNHINRKRDKDKKVGKHRVIPLLISGDFQYSFPEGYERYVASTDWLGERMTYCQSLWALIGTLYDTNPENLEDEWNEFTRGLGLEDKRGITERLSQEDVLDRMVKGKVSGFSPGDEKSGHSSSGSLSDAQLMAIQRKHDSAYADTSESKQDFGRGSSSNAAREDEQQKEGSKLLEAKRS